MRGARAGLFSGLVASPEPQAWAARVEDLARAALRLDAEVDVTVTERVVDLPGCPPLQTVVDFRIDAADAVTRHHLTIFKAARDVDAADFPPWWMRDALRADPDWICSCC